MSELFSHQEQDADIAVRAKKAPSGVVFLEPPAAATTPDEDTPKRPVRPSFS